MAGGSRRADTMSATTAATMATRSSADRTMATRSEVRSCSLTDILRVFTRVALGFRYSRHENLHVSHTNQNDSAAAAMKRSRAYVDWSETLGECYDACRTEQMAPQYAAIVVYTVAHVLTRRHGGRKAKKQAEERDRADGRVMMPVAHAAFDPMPFASALLTRTMAPLRLAPRPSSSGQTRLARVLLCSAIPDWARL